MRPPLRAGLAGLAALVELAGCRTAVPAPAVTSVAAVTAMTLGAADAGANAPAHPVPPGCEASAYPFRYWCGSSADGLPYSRTFSHQTTAQHKTGGLITSGNYCLPESAGSVRIVRVDFRCEGNACGWNYNPSGGYSANVTLDDNQVCFTWRRKWDSHAVTEFYTAVYQKLEER